MKHKKRRYAGRHLLTSASLTLLALTAYEGWIRLDDARIWLSGVRYAAQIYDIPFFDFVRTMFQAAEMQGLGRLLSFLAAGIILALFCLTTRSRPRAAFWLIPADVLVCALGLRCGALNLKPAGWFQTFKLIPMALIAAGSGVNLSHYYIRRRLRRLKKQKERELREPQTTQKNIHRR